MLHCCKLKKHSVWVGVKDAGESRTNSTKWKTFFTANNSVYSYV